MSDQSNINKLTDSISKLKTAIYEYSLAVEKKIAELKNAKSGAEFTVAQSEEEQQKIKEEIERTNVEKAALQDELNIKKETLTDLIVKNLQNGKDLEDSTKKLTIKDEELQGYIKELATQQEIIIRLNTAIEKQAQEAGQLKDQLIALQEKQITNDAAVAAKDTEIVKLRQSKDAEIIRLQNEYNTKETALKESINELQKANGESSEIINNLENDLAKSKTASIEEKENNKTLLINISEKQTQLTERSNQIKEANDLVANMQSQIDDLREKQSTLTAQHSNCQAIIAELNNKIEQANSKINELQKIVEGKTSVLNANDDDNFGVGITGVAPEPVLNTEPTLVEGPNGETKIQLKDELNNKIIAFPYDAETNLPKNDEDGSITGSIIKWSKTIRPDGSTVYTKESTNKNDPTNKIVKKYTVKGGRKRKASKTIKNTIKKHVSNKRNTKRKNKHHKKQTYKR
jgi:chromosome segregation ATPase